MENLADQNAYQSQPFKAYISEPITRCPVREKGRIKTLIGKIAQAMEQPPISTSLYVPSLVSSPEVRKHMTPAQVYLLDRIRIAEADFILVLADHTSFGIGGEVELATSMGKPIVIFSREKTLSRFLTGTPVNAVYQATGEPFILYRDWRDLKPRLLPILEGIIGRLKSDEAETLPIWEVGARIRRLREERRLSINELASRAGVSPHQIAFWEKELDEIRHDLEAHQKKEDISFGAFHLSPRQKEQFHNFGLAALHRISHALSVSVADLVGDATPITLKGPARIARTKFEHVTNMRRENLMLRAEQFDVTFREYKKLEALMVDGFIRELEREVSEPDRAHTIITQEEFQNALAGIRR